MLSRLTPLTIALLVIPPLMWAGNAIVGRMLAPLVPPVTLNFLRWLLLALLLLPLGWRLFAMQQALRRAWAALLGLGLLGMGCYNALQYMALKTSTPINVTLVAASAPVWSMLVGALFFGEKATARQALAAVFSLTGVLVVLSGGEMQRLADLRLVPGDVLMLLASLCWASYSWMLLRARIDPGLRGDWAAFLLAQVGYGLLWSGLFAALEWGAAAAWGWPEGALQLVWGLPLALGLLYVAVGPSLLAYWCWGQGVQRAGPTVAAFFANLTPLFAALMSALLLGEPPRMYHAVAFALIVAGIAVSARK